VKDSYEERSRPGSGPKLPTRKENVLGEGDLIKTEVSLKKGGRKSSHFLLGVKINPCVDSALGKNRREEKYREEGVKKKGMKMTAMKKSLLFAGKPQTTKTRREKKILTEEEEEERREMFKGKKTKKKKGKERDRWRAERGGRPFDLG